MKLRQTSAMSYRIKQPVSIQHFETLCKAQKHNLNKQINAYVSDGDDVKMANEPFVTNFENHQNGQRTLRNELGKSPKWSTNPS
jgi:hypothetical protein